MSGGLGEYHPYGYSAAGPGSNARGDYISYVSRWMALTGEGFTYPNVISVLGINDAGQTISTMVQFEYHSGMPMLGTVGFYRC